ncbi:hypothetical protein GCM10022231_17010 [Gordonia caeni]|uniref:Uncharacterized protein n=1 Tax=Gordonia caeni TaxID=1007097 RepID=A0ABP7P1K2_9ACTN
MQGYGFPRQRPTTGPTAPAVRRGALAAVTALAVLTTSACGLLESQNGPAAIVIPSTNALITESPPSSLPPTSTTSKARSSYTAPAEDSYKRAVSSAPRVGVSSFHIGATTQTGERMNDVSGVHFSTPDRNVRCSTGNNGSGALVCAGEQIRGPRTARSNTPEGCDWKADLAVLNSEGIATGGCANLYPVLYRSHILEYGTTIVTGSFSCLSDVTGLFCLDSASDAGFAISREGYQEIHSDDRAPSEILGGSESTRSSSSAAVPSR